MTKPTIHNPMTIGEFILEAYIKPQQLTYEQFARNCDTNQAAISRLINGKQELTIETACKLEKGTGRSAQSWLNLWVSRKIWEAYQEGKTQFASVSSD